MCLWLLIQWVALCHWLMWVLLLSLLFLRWEWWNNLQWWMWRLTRSRSLCTNRRIRVPFRSEWIIPSMNWGLLNYRRKWTIKGCWWQTRTVSYRVILRNVLIWKCMSRKRRLAFIRLKTECNSWWVRTLNWIAISMDWWSRTLDFRVRSMIYREIMKQLEINCWRIALPSLTPTFWENWNNWDRNTMT